MKIKVLEVCFHCHKRLTPAPGELRMRRRAAGITQTDLAKMLGLSTACVTLLEEGERRPSATTALKLHKLQPRLKALARKRMAEISRVVG